MRLVIEGAPRTKKNSQRIVRTGKGRPALLQSKQYLAWENFAVLQLNRQVRNWLGHAGCARTSGGVSIYAVPVGMRAMVYRDRDGGDLGNYLAAICDALQKAGVVENDRLIESFDGSRLLLDRARPRVEIDIEALP